MDAKTVPNPTVRRTTSGRYVRMFRSEGPKSGVTVADTQAKSALLASPDLTRSVVEIDVKAYEEFISWFTVKPGSEVMLFRLTLKAGVSGHAWPMVESQNLEGNASY
jgi:hypothetical protein